MELGPRDPREREETVDELAHALRREPDSFEVLLALRGQRIGAVLQQREPEPVDAAERRAEVVRDRVAERFELEVRPLRLLDGRPQRGGRLLALGHVLGDAEEIRRLAVVPRDRHLLRVEPPAALLRVYWLFFDVDDVAPGQSLAVLVLEEVGL